MQEFTGFNNQDFAFFLDMPTDYKRILKQKMAAFGEMVYEQLPSEIRHSFKRSKAASIKREVPRSLYSIGKAYSDRTNFQLCGLGLSLDLAKLSFGAIIRGGSYMDGKPVGILYNKISHGPEEFLNLLTSYGSPYTLTVFRRLPAKGDKITPNLEKWETISFFNLGLTNFELVEYILAVLEQDKLPGIQLSFNIFAGDNILTEPQQLVTKAVKHIIREYKLLDYLEE